jgi:hypothetical protein
MAKRGTRKSRHAQPLAKPASVAEPRVLAPPRWLPVAGVVASVALFLVVYIMRLDPVVGQYQDDAWYTVLAKALATGQGYTLISAPASGIGAWIYPPGYPALLALAWRAWPEFPQNVWLLKSISIAAMFVAGVACYFYFARVRETPRHVAAGIALATVFNPAFVFLATSTLMSECVFTMAQLLAILTIERAVPMNKAGGGWPLVVLGTVLASFAFVTRAMGLTLLVGVFLYFLKERLIRGALVFAVIAGVLLGPLAINAWLSAPTAEQRDQQASYIVSGMGEVFWHRQAGNPAAGQIGVADLPARMWNNLMTVATHTVGVTTIGPLPYWEKGGELTAESSPATRTFSLILSAIAALGLAAIVRTRVTLAEFVFALSLLVIAIFPWTPFRYFLPLSPFLMFYVLMGIRSVYELYKRWRVVPDARAPWVTAGLVAGFFVALNVYTNAQYISSLRSDVREERPPWVRIFEEHALLFTWIRENIPEQRTFISSNPPLLYLYTGQKTLPAVDAALRKDVWEQHKVRYLVQMGVPRPPDPNEAERRLKTLYTSGTILNLRVVDLGEAPLK